MALADQVKSRFGGTDSQYLVNLTRNLNPDGGSTIDDTVLGLAVDDVEADMEIYAGQEYDDDPTTNPDDYKKQINVAVQCVIIKLQLATGKTPDKIAKWLTERYQKILVDLSKVTSRDRFFIESSSPYQESDQMSDGNPILPDFDPALVDFFVPGARAGLNSSQNPATDP